MLTNKQQSASATKFANKWRGRGYEKGDSQIFWTELLTEVFGIEDPSRFIRFEEQVKMDNTSFIDAHIPTTKTLIEQKSLGKDLRKGIQQSDGSVLTPFQQAKRYAAELKYSERPRWIIACNFEEFLVYDMERPHSEPEQILLENLGKEYYRLQFLVDEKSEHLKKEMQVSMQAGEIVGKLYDELLKQYIDPSDPHTLKSLNVLCVRLVFCLYAEDAGIFGRHNMFHDYLDSYPTDELRNALISLFKVLNTPISNRDPYLNEALLAFPYTNGGLFADDHIVIPRMNNRIRQLLLENASMDFNWSEISPTIFGAVFESTLNPDTRRSSGMHYTSIENIHKVIDPLFMDDLLDEFNHILEEKLERQRNQKLERFQAKLSSLKFLDPACGSGNFLTETYLSMRRLENEVIRTRYNGQTMMGTFVNPVKVSINQFYGIEINDFAVTVATTALWISESQMLAETERIVQQDIDYLPLKNYTNIREGNALLMDWEYPEVPSEPLTISADMTYLLSSGDSNTASEPVIKYNEINLLTSGLHVGPKPPANTIPVHYDYIISNPPFIGYSLQSKEQKADLSMVCHGCGKNIDYVAGWYCKAAKLICNSTTRVALVSTNSITQGEQVAAIWKKLIADYGIRIDFAYRTFRWDSEATQKAHVHCVIIGFSSKSAPDRQPHIIYDGERITPTETISPYLLPASTIIVESRKKPLADIPSIMKGSIPVDGGNLILDTEECEEIIKREPSARKFIRRFIGAKEFLHNQPRYCLWLKEASPSELHQMPLIYKRLEKVREFRLSSKKAATRKFADYPARFMEIRQPHTNYIIIPSHSSVNRRYIPMGFMSPDMICGNANLMIPNATLYHFGILESNVHMAWMRTVCGRLKSDYRYSNDIVYNNFPWPAPTEAQRKKIEDTAQRILEARSNYPDSSLADLYDELTMPEELRKAHQQNDSAVMSAYGFDAKTMTENCCIAELFRMYEQLSKTIK